MTGNPHCAVLSKPFKRHIFFCVSPKGLTLSSSSKFPIRLSAKAEKATPKVKRFKPLNKARMLPKDPKEDYGIHLGSYKVILATLFKGLKSFICLQIMNKIRLRINSLISITFWYI